MKSHFYTPVHAHICVRLNLPVSFPVSFLSNNKGGPRPPNAHLNAFTE
ncbi:hypothetical protein HMP0721_0416 [Pseudoramibacter alactolyticus ATCC 23263]|uniref:Uncharacterized protein n=1 Tax=Pseudoramibacter alactolyticus ATCC 23263 TaxID=887929 RepID=E6MEI3_9FIRM|nr:hypothetical protein HMP0721_0416 [Pseudoramibacter alactolyticus ATCC 23263]